YINHCVEMKENSETRFFSVQSVVGFPQTSKVAVKGEDANRIMTQDEESGSARRRRLRIVRMTNVWRRFKRKWM
ncbi:hypothetical protein AM503_03125, partial [Klebsiella michiganensis]|uniref:hypothetical protein n=1 Tax=Klebsiella michiganensis TaxID=1134687 RepID=UPI0037BFAEFD